MDIVIFTIYNPPQKPQRFSHIAQLSIHIDSFIYPLHPPK